MRQYFTPKTRFHLKNCFSLHRQTILGQAHLITEMKKNSPISHSSEVILHAFNKRGFFAVPVCMVFSVRPIPFWVRR
jgi:hypothetical protein